MRGSVCQLLLLAPLVAAITGPRIENDFDRSRQPPIGHSGFNDQHQQRFAASAPIQNFQSQTSLLSSPSPPLQFSHSIFQQQPYVPQFNNLLSAQNTPNNLPVQNNNGFQFSQPINVPNNAQLNNFQQQNLGQIQQNRQPNIQQPIPTLAAFQNNGLPLNQNSPQTFNQNPTIHSSIELTQQRPSQATFLPTLNNIQNQQAFHGPNPITIQAAPNLAPQNLNNPQIPFQSSLNQGPIYSSGQASQLRDYYEQQSKENLEKLKELQERQRLIQKHQEFVQKQQQKQQEKVEKLHEEFVSKQATKTIPTYTTTEDYEDYFKRNQEKRRPLLPHETDLFRKAVQQYEKEHPTTTTSTTTTTTTTTTRPPTRYRTRTPGRTRGPPQDRNKQKLYNEIKNLLEESDTKGFDDNLRAKSVALLQKPDILKQLKVALAENPEDFNEKNFSSREISLNGQKFEVIRTTNPNLIPKGAIAADSPDLGKIIATKEPQKESRISFDDLTKDVLPPGANFELIKQTDNGKLEEVENIPSNLQNKKKVTFVFLEEQDDGSYKVKGVKANGQQTEEGPEVENILNKIKKGEIQLPGPTKISNVGYTSTTASPITQTTDYIAESSHHPSSYTSFVTTSNYGNSGHTNPMQTTPAPTYRNSVVPSTRPTAIYTQTQPPTTRGTTTERYVIRSSTPKYILNRSSHIQSSRNSFPSTTNKIATSTHRTTPQDIVIIGSSTASIATPNFEESTINLNYEKDGTPGLIDVLKENGLFATAKYLKQSGLDAILNETGPYTIFAPTDKAFRTLLVQLGGPDRAEEKFRDNPRLLSGLLLHHVIPGSFDIGSLQDEMTGVSLAGTQLRVNQYDMHDVEWNEVRVTTINGARVLEDKKDIHIPQGIAHAVDRVMFPLPVGDLVQTLQADRDRRFTTFLKAIQASGFADTLAESKTYTVFAPTDAAFARLPPAELSRYAERAGARALVARHVLTGTLYSAGMRYYQLRNSMEDAKPLTLQKSSGRIKVNNAQVITHNIPATNGVIHAVDTLL